jgi:hypothetical protein
MIPMGDGMIVMRLHSPFCHHFRYFRRQANSFNFGISFARPNVTKTVTTNQNVFGSGTTVGDWTVTAK